MARVVELTYPRGREIFHNVLTAHAPTSPESDLAHCSACPYCSANVEIFLQESRPFCWETVQVQYAQCAGCGWWRKRWWPNHYFVGETIIGTLHIPDQSAVEKAERALDDFCRDTRWEALRPSDVERQVGALMAAAWGAEVIHVGRAGDGGVDLILFDSDEGPITVQVKHRRSDRRAESVGVVRELRGAMVLYGADRGVVVTTAPRFSSAAKDAATPSPHHTVLQAIDLVDASRLLDMMRLVVAVGHGETTGPPGMIDDPYWPSSGPDPGSETTVLLDAARNARRATRRDHRGYIV